MIGYELELTTSSVSVGGGGPRSGNHLSRRARVVATIRHSQGAMAKSAG
jgi:hypothetical protein